MVNFLNFIPPKSIFSIVVFSFNLLTLCGCHQVKEGFGLTRSQPDEFMVEDQAPLTLPPFFTLKSPLSFKENENQRDISINLPQEKAKKMILKSKSLAAKKNIFSSSEKEIAYKSGIEEKRKDIRAVLNQDYKELVDKSPAKLFSQENPVIQGEALEAEEEHSQHLKSENINDD